MMYHFSFTNIILIHQTLAVLVVIIFTHSICPSVHPPKKTHYDAKTKQAIMLRQEHALTLNGVWWYSLYFTYEAGKVFQKQPGNNTSATSL